MINSPPIIAVHIAAGLLAGGLGAIQAVRMQRDGAHRIAGGAFVATMLVLCASSYWIRTDGGFSWIHALSVWSLLAISLGLTHLRRGRRRSHGRWMLGAWVGLLVAFLFSLSPNRLIGAWLFG